MITENIFEDRLANLRLKSKPLRIEFTVRCADGKYYIDVDGSKSYKDDETWNIVWGGLGYYIGHLLRDDGFVVEQDSITKINNTHVEVYIGTLFDFIKNVKENG